MFKKFFAWVKSLFVPVTIKEADVDEFISKQSQERETVDQVRFTRTITRPLKEPLKDGEVLVGVNIDEKTAKVVTVETQPYNRPKAPATPPKPLDEQMKGVPVPGYAKGKLPPKAKRQYINQARRAAPRKMSDSPTGYGTSQVGYHGTDTANAALYGYMAGSVLASDNTPSAPAPVEECRSSAAISTYSSSYGGSSSSSSYDSSSYDSGSYDSGSSSSCD